MSSTIPSSRAVRTATEDSVQPKEPEEIVRSLRILLAGDEREQRETFTFLKQALDEDRPSSRKLFPST
jgi:hypothetical protein